MVRETFKLWTLEEYSDHTLTDAVRVGSTLYLAGQSGQCPVTGKWGVGFEEQAVLTWRNIERILQQFQLDCSALVSTFTIVSDAADWEQFNKISALFIPRGVQIAATGVACERWNPILVETVAVARFDAK